MKAPFRETLIEARELAPLLDDPDVAVLDCRHDLTRPDWGRQAFRQAHIPGALHAHVDHDLSGPITPRSGRHPLPLLDEFAERAGSWGIDADVQVVVYDQGNGAYAARAWWLFRWAGHAAVALLNGGFAAWQSAGLPLSHEAATRRRRKFVPSQPLTRTVTTAQVVESLGTGELRLIDARAAERFAGRNETIDPVAGHVPGAINHPFAGNVDANGTFLPREELRRRWEALAAGRPTSDLAVMCGSGVTACHHLLALEIAGMAGAALYAGSWSEWIREPSRPVALGPADG